MPAIIIQKTVRLTETYVFKRERNVPFSPFNQGFSKGEEIESFLPLALSFSDFSASHRKIYPRGARKLKNVQKIHCKCNLSPFSLV